MWLLSKTMNFMWIEMQPQDHYSVEVPPKGFSGTKGREKEFYNVKAWILPKFLSRSYFIFSN